MKDILVEDELKKLEKLNLKIDQMSKEIELLTLSNQKLLEKYENKQQKEEKLYNNLENNFKNQTFTTVGLSKVLIPEGYKINKKGLNGVLFSNDKTDIGIYEVLSIDSYEDKVKEWKTEYNNNIKTSTYHINDICLKSVIVLTEENNKKKESYFEKNGRTYHIFEKGVEDKIAFNTLFYSIKINNLIK